MQDYKVWWEKTREASVAASKVGPEIQQFLGARAGSMSTLLCSPSSQKGNMVPFADADHLYEGTSKIFKGYLQNKEF